MLGKSYRLPSVVRGYAERWVRQIKNRKEKVYEPVREGGIVRRSPTDYTFPELGLLATVRECIKAGKTVMILGATRYQLRAWAMVMKKHGIPFHNPYRRSNLWWNPLNFHSPVTTSAKQTAAFLAVPWTWADMYEWTRYLGKKVLRRGGVKWVESMKASRKIVGHEDLMKLLRDEVVVPALGRDLRWWQSLLPGRNAKRVEYPIRVVEAYGERGLTGKPKVTLGTIHSVKGGQANTVILHPDLSAAGWERDINPKGRAANNRMFYVGMTRARDELVLCYPHSKRTTEWR